MCNVRNGLINVRIVQLPVIFKENTNARKKDIKRTQRISKRDGKIKSLDHC